METDAVSLNFFFGLICWFQLANNFSVPFNFSLYIYIYIYTEKRNLPIAACDSLLVPNYLACSTDFDLPFLLIYLSICLSIHLSIYRSIHISTVSSSIQQKKIFAVNAKCSACSSRGARGNSVTVCRAPRQLHTQSKEGETCSVVCVGGSSGSLETDFGPIRHSTYLIMVCNVRNPILI